MKVVCFFYYFNLDDNLTDNFKVSQKNVPVLFYQKFLDFIVTCS